MAKTSELFDKLYHYTTWDGLLGILQSQSLWATHYKFLNDYSEIVLFRDKMVSLILPYVSEAYEKLIKMDPQAKQRIDGQGGLGHVVKHDTETYVDAQYHVTGDEIYILSFCGQHKVPHINNNGLLSQWRGYGAGGGFALEFNTKKLEDLLEIESYRYAYNTGHLSDLIYSDDDDKLKDELSGDLSIIADAVKLMFDSMMTDDKLDEDAISNSYVPFVNCISRYKHCGFKEEKEVRIVALPTVMDQTIINMAMSDGLTLRPEKERKYRNQNGHHVPYIELFNSTDLELPIEKIIVGPHKDKDVRAATLRVMLNKTNIEVTCSDIPYVG